MKRFRRIISSALATVLTLTALVTVTNAKQFNDVPSTAPLLDAINYAVDNNFIEPTSSTTFSPNSYMTRGNMVLMLYRHSGETVNSTNTGFTDVPSSSPYARAVVWAVANGITNGTTNTTFEPNTNIKRQDAAVFMYRYAQYMGHRTDYTSTLADFTDSGRVQPYALTAMQWAVGAGIISGTTATTLEPRVALKRGAAAAMLQRYGISVEIHNTQNNAYLRNIYGFTNTSNNFNLSNTSTHYYIDEEDLGIMIDYMIENGDDTSAVWNSITQWILEKSWNDSSYGMCISMLLDKAGEINVNNRLSNTRFLSQINSTNINPRIVSLINYYHVLQTLKGHEYYYGASNIFNFLQVLFEVTYTGLCEVEIKVNINGTITKYSFVAYKTVYYNDGTYRLYVYDPSIGSMNSYLFFELGNNNDLAPSARYYPHGGNVYLPIEGIAFKTIDEVREDYKDYDIDGDFNTGVPDSTIFSLNESDVTSVEKVNASTDNMSLFSDMVNESRTTLYIACDKDFTISNADGDYLVYNSETYSFSGNMPLYRQAETFINGFTHVLTIPADDSYEIVTEAHKVSFNILSKDSFNGIEATNAKSIMISENNEIKVTGEKAEVVSTFGTANLNITKEVK